MERPLKVLIIVSNRENYIERLYGHQLIDGRFIEVEQAPWVFFSLIFSSYYSFLSFFLFFLFFLFSFL